MSLEELREQRGKRIHQRSVTTGRRAHLWDEKEGEEETVLPAPRSRWSDGEAHGDRAGAGCAEEGSVPAGTFFYFSINDCI